MSITEPIMIDHIRAVLPHRYPMLLIDRVVDLVPGVSITAIKAVTANEVWYDDRSPGRFDYPPVLLIESWCQAAALLWAWETPNPDVLSGQVMLFGGMSAVRILSPVRPGDVVRHQVVLTKGFADSAVFEGEAMIGDQPVLTVRRVVVAARPAEQLPDLPGLTGLMVDQPGGDQVDSGGRS